MRSPDAIERAFLAAQYMDEERRLAKERKSAKLRAFARGDPAWKPPPGDPRKTDARTNAIARTGGWVHHLDVGKAEFILKNGIPELTEAARTSKVDLAIARKIAEDNPRTQKEKLNFLLHNEVMRVREKPVNHALKDRAFVRKIISGLERVSLVCAEEGADTLDKIADRFLAEMNWNDQAMLLQWERCENLLGALQRVRQRRPMPLSAARPAARVYGRE